MKIFKIIILLYIFQSQYIHAFQNWEKKIERSRRNKKCRRKKGKKCRKNRKRNSKRNKARANRRNKVIRYLYKVNDLDFDLEGIYNVFKG